MNQPRWSKPASEQDDKSELPWSGARFLKHMLRGGAVVLLTQIGFVTLTFAIGVLLARSMGTAGYGAFTNAMAWINVATLPATLGFAVLLTRQVAVFRSSRDWSQLGAMLAFADRRVMATSVLVMLCIGLLSMVLYQGSDATLMRQTLWIALPLLPLLALSRLREGTLRGWEALAQAQVPGMLLRPALLLCGLLVAWWGGFHQVTPVLAMMLNLLAALVALYLLVVWTRQLIPVTQAHATNREQGRAWILAALPMMVAGNMQVLLTQTDVLVLGALLGADQTGVYSAVTRLAYLLFYGNAAVDLVLAPIIARFHARQQLKELQPVLTRVVRWSWAFMLVLGLVVVFYRVPLLGVFGPEFRVGEMLVVVMVSGRILETALGSGALVLLMAKNEMMVAKVYGIAAIANLMMNLLLVPVYGAVGAVVATLLAGIGAKLLFAILARRAAGIGVTVLG